MPAVMSSDFCLLLPQASNVDHEPIFDVTLQHPLVSFVDVFHRDHLDLARDSALRAEIEHLLRFGHSPDQRAGQASASTNQRHGANRLCKLLCLSSSSIVRLSPASFSMF